ncbi:MAG: hypothetical protein WBW88_15280 [Rhodothermales bacterium]
MKTVSLMLFTALLLLVGCSGDTLTSVQDESAFDLTSNDGIAKQGIKMVPYRGIVTGHPVEQAPHPDCPGATVIRSTGEGTGKGTLLGSFTWSGWHCFDYVALTFYDGHITSVAANGDELRFEYHGQLTGPNSWISTDTIVGGTGRFANATGWADEIGGSADTPEGEIWNMEYNGMVSSVGSSK